MSGDLSDRFGRKFSRREAIEVGGGVESSPVAIQSAAGMDQVSLGIEAVSDRLTVPWLALWSRRRTF